MLAAIVTIILEVRGAGFGDARTRPTCAVFATGR
jgi:hypothetical protein